MIGDTSEPSPKKIKAAINITKRTTTFEDEVDMSEVGNIYEPVPHDLLPKRENINLTAYSYEEAVRVQLRLHPARLTNGNLTGVWSKATEDMPPPPIIPLPKRKELSKLDKLLIDLNTEKAMWAINVHLNKDCQYKNRDEFLQSITRMQIALPNATDYAPGRQVYFCPHYHHFYYATMTEWEQRERERRRQLRKDEYDLAARLGRKPKPIPFMRIVRIRVRKVEPPPGAKHDPEERPLIYMCELLTGKLN
jgi:hypothetical protein